jgi:hypothetical protein
LTKVQPKVHQCTLVVDLQVQFRVDYGTML